jgi:hypothetical protein
MSICDPITVEYNEKRKKYYLLRGRETFYDEDNYWRLWDTPEEAIEWAKKEGLWVDEDD